MPLTRREPDALLERVRRELERARPVAALARERCPGAPHRARKAPAFGVGHRRTVLGLVAGLAFVTSVALGAHRLHGEERRAPAAAGHATVMAQAAPPAALPDPEPSTELALPAPSPAPEPPEGPPRAEPERFTVEVVNTGKTVDVVLAGPAGEPDEASYRSLRHELRSNSGAESPLDPRLIEVLHQVAKRTGGSVQVLSAFRPPKSPGDRNYHTRGMAADIRVAGMSAVKLRELARSLGVPGIGYYPTSHFVHVDMRDKPFQWTDTSGPGQNADDPPAQAEAHAAVSQAPSRSQSRGAAEEP